MLHSTAETSADRARLAHAVGPWRSRRRRLLASMLVVTAAGAIVGALPPAAVAATSLWSPVRGLAGGQIVQLAAAPLVPGTIYGASGGGLLWKSADGGESWSLAGVSPEPLILWMAVAAGAPDTLYLLGYALNEQAELWKSLDGGATWSLSSGGLLFSGLATTPSSPQTLFAVVLTPFSAQGTALLRSDDAGGTWTPLPPGPFQQGLINALWIDPTTPEILFARDNTHLYKSLDGGSHWRQAAADDSSLQGIEALVFDPHDHRVLYAAVSNLVDLLKSSDGGATWTAANRGIETAFPGHLLIGAFGTLFMISLDNEVYSSTDGAAHWRHVGSLGFSHVDSVVVDSGTTERLYATLDQTDGVTLSTDGGHTWSPQVAGLAALAVTELVASPLRPRTVYAEALSSSSPFPGNSHRSQNRGRTWSTLAATGLEFEMLTQDPHAGVLYATGYYPGIGPNTVWKSTDDGASWAAATTSAGFGLSGLAADPRASGSLWALGLPDSGPAAFLVHSTDGGAAWSIVNQLDDALQSHISAGGVFLAHARAGTLYFLLRSGRLFASSDDGVTLSPAQPASPVIDLVVDPSHVGVLYAATTDAHPLWRSTDGGTAWVQASRGLPLGTRVVALAMDPARSSTLYAATDRGVWVTDNGAQSWRALGTGLPQVPLLSIAAVVGGPRTVLVGTAGAGAYSLTR